jgi:outer membrane lipoprotein-sorting protein
MKQNTIIALLAAIFTFAFAVPVLSQDVNELLQKMDKVIFSPRDKQGYVKITTINQSGKEKIREAEMFQKGNSKRLYRYTAPESQVGISTLSLPDGIMWMYMPAFGKPKKITLLAKSQSFSGTDFSYEDMSVTSYADNYSGTLVETTEDNYLIELIPNNEKSNYSKILLTMDKVLFTQKKMDYFDKGGNKFKVSSFEYAESGDYLYAKKVTMANLKKQSMTKIEFTEVVFDQGLDDELFVVENMVPEDKRKEK